MQRLAVWVAGLALLTTAEVRAQDAQTPESFVVEYMAATRAADWNRVTSFMHPEALDQFKRVFGALAEMDSAGAVIPQLFGIEPAEFAATPADSVFTTFMKTLVNLSPELGALLEGATVTPIGHVEEASTGLTLVVYRMNMGKAGLNISQLEVAPLKQHDGRWRAMLTGEIEGMAAAIRQRMDGGI